MDLSLAPKQPCQMKSQREFCKSKLLPLFSLLLSFTELAILQTLQSPLSTQTIPSFSLLLSFTELAISRPRYISHNGRMYSLASISSRGATQTFEEYKAWPGLDILATLEKYMAWPAYPAQVSSRHLRNTMLPCLAFAVLRMASPLYNLGYENLDVFQMFTKCKSSNSLGETPTCAP